MIEYTEKEMEYVSSKDPVMKDLVERYGHITAGTNTDFFQSLIFHMIGQMLSNKVAEVLADRFDKLAGEITPENVSKLTVEQIRSCGISSQKAKYILGMTENVIDGELDLSGLNEMSDEEVITYLISIKGIGRWTAEMITEFTLGRRNVFSYGDAALRNGIMKAHGFKTLSKRRFHGLIKKYSPYCSVASLYYYALNDDNDPNLK